jgi:tyrosyl-tRNA synthetase
MAKKVNETQIKEIFGRGVAEIIGGERLFQALEKGETLRFKMGMDPTSPDIHIGHAVGLRILRKLQDLGHEVVIIIGDYTARIGDPSGRSKTRPPLDPETIDANAETYLAQVGKILDVKKIELVKNSKWLAKLTFADLIKYASNFTVARILERDDFAKRYKAGTEIYLHEMLYPLMQAYDSVAIKAAVEMGGTDQTFNMLAGRELQKKLGLPEQAVVACHLLVGLDGVNKMSKSLGNYIGVTESAESMYGKVMSIPDKLIMNYFELATELPTEEITKIKNEMLTGANPRDVKMRLAREIASLYHSKKEVTKAEEAFVKTFQKKEVPDEIPEKKVSTDILVDVLVEVGFASSKSEARRTVEQGGVKINGTVVRDAMMKIKGTDLIQKGKRSFVRVLEVNVSN